MFFKKIHTERGGKARAGELNTDRGKIETPVFMPVGTQGTVKTLSPRDLREQNVRIILGNSYHLYLRPGADVIERFGGLHQFINWDGPILTDSGGYQVFSLKTLRTLDADGVTFQSHLDGSRHRFTAEKVLEIQRRLGSDIMMVLDECPPYPADYEYADRSNDITVKWARISREQYATMSPPYGKRQWLFAIIQGSVYSDLREKSARQLMELDFPGYAIGGLSVGEPKKDMFGMTDICTDILPADKPRYLMGVGMPEDMLEAIDLGVDMFDCVIPTRNARNGTVFTGNGKLVIKAARNKEDERPLDPDCACYTCTNFSRGYVRHLFNSGEILGLHLATLHNIHFYTNLLEQAREKILTNCYRAWKDDILKRISRSAEEPIPG